MDKQRDSTQNLFDPLPTATSIRLLHLRSVDLQNNRPDGLLHVHLSHADLNEDPSFCALSYTWGNPLGEVSEVSSYTQNVTILCNNKEIKITRNLHAALKCILDLQSVEDGGVKPLWVDSVCINQADKKERSAQVSIMDQIYAKAETTIAWLGPPDKCSNFILPLSRALSALKDNTSEDEAYWAVFNKLLSNITSLNGFLGRTYFSRCWIFQEVVLSRRVYFLCGLDTITFEDLLHLAEVKESHGQAIIIPAMTRTDLTFSRVHSFSIKTLYRQRKALHDHTCDTRAFGFSHLLELTREYQCSEAKDKVYSIFGLIPQNSRSAISMAPDYFKSVEEVWSEATRACILRDGYLDTLAWVVDPSDRTYPQFPSWICELSPHGMSSENLARKVSTSTATADSRAVIDPELPVDHRLLLLSGIQCDSVMDIAKPPAWHNLAMSIDSVWEHAMLFEKQDAPYVVPQLPTSSVLPMYYAEKEATCVYFSQSGDYLEAAPSVFQTRSRRDICFSTIRYMHELCWFSDTRSTDDTYHARALKVLDALRQAQRTEYGIMYPGTEELQLLEAFTCDCNASLVCSALSDAPTKPRYFNKLCPYIEALRHDLNSDPGQEWLSTSPPLQYFHSNFGDRSTSNFLQHVFAMERLARTKNGHLALIPKSSVCGDAVFLLEGARTPFIMRKADSEDERPDNGVEWKIIAPAYVHGAMRGEVWEKVKHLVHPVHVV